MDLLTLLLFLLISNSIRHRKQINYKSTTEEKESLGIKLQLNAVKEWTLKFEKVFLSLKIIMKDFPCHSFLLHNYK